MTRVFSKKTPSRRCPLGFCFVAYRRNPSRLARILAINVNLTLIDRVVWKPDLETLTPATKKRASVGPVKTSLARWNDKIR